MMVCLLVLMCDLTSSLSACQSPSMSNLSCDTPSLIPCLMRERSKSFTSVVVVFTCFPLQAAIDAARNDLRSALSTPALSGRLVGSKPLQYPEQRLKGGVLPLR